MENPIKMGKLSNYRNMSCTICGKESSNFISYSGWINHWLCEDCKNKMKFKPKDIVWFLKFNKDLEKLEIICGSVKYYSNRRIKTYAIEYHISDGPFKRCNVYEDYIFATKDECIAYGNEIGEVASDLQIQDLNLMKKQAKVYKQISDFLKSSEAIQFNITGLDAKVDDGYVNVEWKFGSRKDKDIKE